MKSHHSLADFLEYLWDRGFKLTDEQVRFIYFAKKYTNSSEWLSSIALEAMLKLQFKFNRSFYISLLELLNEHGIRSKKELKLLLIEKGFNK